MKRSVQLLLFLALMLRAASAMANQFQTVIQLDCKGKSFIIEGRAFAANEAGSSHVERRYSYMGINLRAVNYELYYKSLDNYLLADQAVTQTLKLHLATDGLSHYGGEYETGETLYLPPSYFSDTDFKELGECLNSNIDEIRNAAHATKILGSALLGFMKTEAPFGVDGVARIVHSDSPLKQLYRCDDYHIAVDNFGSAWMGTHWTSENKNSVVHFGSVRDPQKKTLAVPLSLSIDGQTKNPKKYSKCETAAGRSVDDDYKIVLESQ